MTALHLAGIDVLAAAIQSSGSGGVDITDFLILMFLIVLIAFVIALSAVTETVNWVSWLVIGGAVLVLFSYVIDLMRAAAN